MPLFKYKAIDGSGIESNEATVTFTFKHQLNFPTYYRCILNVAPSSSTVIDLADSKCVIPVDDGSSEGFFCVFLFLFKKF